MNNSKSCKDRWYPTPVDTYKLAFIVNEELKNYRSLKSNLAYSMQYLEYLEKQIVEGNNSSVIETMLCKNYVITAMSIIEGILCNLLAPSGLCEGHRLGNMIDIITKDKSILGFDASFYSSLDKLKVLRDKVHLQNRDNNYDHDYNDFDVQIKDEMKAILYEFVTHEKVSYKPEVFDVLKPDSD